MPRPDTRLPRTGRHPDIPVVNPRAGVVSDLRLQAHELGELMRMGPPESQPGRGNFATIDDAVNTLGLPSHQARRARHMIQQVINDAKDLLSVAKGALDAGIPREAVTELIRRGRDLKYTNDQLLAKARGYPVGTVRTRKDGSQWQKLPQGNWVRAKVARMMGHQPSAGDDKPKEKGAKNTEKKADTESSPRQRFENVQKKAAAAGKKVHGAEHFDDDVHGHEHVDALERQLAQHIQQGLQNGDGKDEESKPAEAKPGEGKDQSAKAAPAEGARSEGHDSPEQPHERHRLTQEVHDLRERLARAEGRLDSEHQRGMYKELMGNAQEVAKDPSLQALEWLSTRILSFLALVTGIGAGGKARIGGPSTGKPPTRAPQSSTASLPWTQAPPFATTTVKKSMLMLDLATGRLVMKAKGRRKKGRRKRQHASDSTGRHSRPGGGGWGAIPGGKKGGFRRKVSGRYQYWYPGEGSSKSRHEQHIDLSQYNLTIVAGSEGQLTAVDIQRAKRVAAKIREGIGAAADVCKISPSVCEGNLGIPRKHMPQIMETSIKEMLASNDPKERKKAQAAIDVGADPNETKSVKDQLLDSIREDGIKIASGEVAVGELKATQREIKAGKAFGMADAFYRGKFRPQDAEIIISSDNHILDGHHRWAALVTAAPDVKMKVTRVDMPMREFLKRSLAHPGVFRADLQGDIVDPSTPLDLGKSMGLRGGHVIGIAKAAGAWSNIPGGHKGGQRRRKARGYGYDYRYHETSTVKKVPRHKAKAIADRILQDHAADHHEMGGRPALEENGPHGSFSDYRVSSAIPKSAGEAGMDEYEHDAIVNRVEKEHESMLLRKLEHAGVLHHVSEVGVSHGEKSWLTSSVRLHAPAAAKPTRRRPPPPPPPPRKPAAKHPIPESREAVMAMLTRDVGARAASEELSEVEHYRRRYPGGWPEAIERFYGPMLDAEPAARKQSPEIWNVVQHVRSKTNKSVLPALPLAARAPHPRNEHGHRDNLVPGMILHLKEKHAERGDVIVKADGVFGMAGALYKGGHSLLSAIYGNQDHRTTIRRYFKLGGERQAARADITQQLRRMLKADGVVVQRFRGGYSLTGDLRKAGVPEYMLAGRMRSVGPQSACLDQAAAFDLARMLGARNA